MESLPDIRDLADRLRFSPDLGRIWRDGERCVLMSSNALTMVRAELIEGLGLAKAQRLFWEIGYSEGGRCALTAKELRPDRNFLDAFAVGPQAHALTGFGWTEIVSLHNDEQRGQFEGTFLVHDSFEAVTHLATNEVNTDPVCWMQAGFASGFASTFAGQPIEIREVECQGMGDPACLLRGKPAGEWTQEAQETHANLSPYRTGDGCKVFGEQTVLGMSAGFLAVQSIIERTAATNATLLFLGETGVGKEIFARMAHALSDRRDSPFVALNCAAIPEGLIEAELFGVAKGAYTGAVAARPGRFELADGGTLFLDEISMLSPMAQGKLLRVIQEGEFERVGEVKTRKVDLRLMAASNVDLRQAVEAGSFRADLYYRLSTMPVNVPPLRKRREDIPGLIEYFRSKYAQKHNRTVTGFTNRALNALLAYDYPGNVRELERMVERAVLLVEQGQAIDLRNLFLADQAKDIGDTYSLGDDGRVEPQFELTGLARRVFDGLKQGSAELAELEDEIFLLAVDDAQGNIAQAARNLGLTRRQLAFRLEKISARD